MKKEVGSKEYKIKTADNEVIKCCFFGFHDDYKNKTTLYCDRKHNKGSLREILTHAINTADYTVELTGKDDASKLFVEDKWVKQLFGDRPIDSLLKALKPNFLTSMKEDRENANNFLAVYKPTLKIWDDKGKTQFITLYIKTIFSPDENPKVISFHLDKKLYNEKSHASQAYNKDFEKENIISNPVGWEMLDSKENRTYRHKVEVPAEESAYNRELCCFLESKYGVGAWKRATTRMVERDVTLKIPSQTDNEHQTTMTISDPMNGKNIFYCSHPINEEIESFEKNYVNLSQSQKEKLLKGEDVKVSVPCLEIFNGHKVYRIQGRNGADIPEPLETNLKSFSIFNKHINDLSEEERSEILSAPRITLKEASDDLLDYYKKQKYLQNAKNTINKCREHLSNTEEHQKREK